MLKLGVPSKYTLEREEGAKDCVLKTLYQYTMQDKMKEVRESVNAYFEDKY